MVIIIIFSRWNFLQSGPPLISIWSCLKDISNMDPLSPTDEVAGEIFPIWTTSHQYMKLLERYFQSGQPLTNIWSCWEILWIWTTSHQHMKLMERYFQSGQPLTNIWSCWEILSIWTTSHQHMKLLRDISNLDHLSPTYEVAGEIFRIWTPSHQHMKLLERYFQSAPLTNISLTGRCPWCKGYRRRKWTRFKSWARMIAFHIALIPLGKVWIQLFSLQLWVNSRTD